MCRQQGYSLLRMGVGLVSCELLLLLRNALGDESPGRARKDQITEI